jgi:hypothetical protein
VVASGSDRPLSERFPRCSTCGRLVPRLEGDHCSARCRGLAQSGYVSPAVPPVLLRAPTSSVDAQIIVEGPSPAHVPAGAVDVGPIRSVLGERRMLRVAVESYEELEQVVSALRSDVGSERVKLLTIQRIAPGGLMPSTPHSRGG